MSDTDLPTRFLLIATPVQAAALLPALGRSMVTLNRAGATHERIGPVESATAEAGTLRIGGAAHESSLALDQVAQIVADRSGGMRGKVFPRIEFQAADGTALLTVIGMDGLEPFDAAVQGWAGAALEPRARPEAPAQAPDAPPTDPGREALEALRASGGEVEIRIVAGPASQSWRGRIEEVKPAMGFANILRPDFHLHLRDGSVAGFRASGEDLEALDAEGAPSGLVLRPLDPAAREALARFA
ncbi:hypothetical protein GXW74_24470 [Roseomonas eburnea]|uniref:Uncharacterized protein n=1 Tax=Neoroseomonas eburnea TaxID=1346889 RepID=A0A9X9XIX2_9PROT|nr:hypothetical protein [Neoroseomonas eburnea]MBR0683658.1 hypothetical protein [Neoroseomonas eburnea]